MNRFKASCPRTYWTLAACGAYLIAAIAGSLWLIFHH